MAHVGDRVGPYRLEARLGNGAMGAVFRAVHQTLGRTVALKLLAPDWSKDEEAHVRFVREVRLATQVVHPNLVLAYDCEITAEVPYLALELVEGEDVLRLLNRVLPPLDHALSIGAEVASALAALHAATILHRDVKPANIFLTRDGTAKLGDLGLARAASSTLLTASGATVGSLSYMAPELLRGRDATPASDLYALGVVVFELLTRELPVSADTPQQLVTAVIRNEVRRADAVNPAVPGPIADLVGELLVGDPEKRASSAALVTRRFAALREPVPARTASAPRAPPVPRVTRATGAPKGVPTEPPRRRRWPALLAASVAGCAALALFSWRRPPPPPRASVPSIAPTPSQASLVPSPASPVPATAIFPHWRAHIDRLPALRNSRTAAATVAELAAKVPLRLGKSPEAWIHYLELGSWLDRRSRAPAPRGSAARRGLLQDFEDLRIFDLFRLSFEGNRARLYVELLDALRGAPEDGRLWLLFGQLLEREKLTADATRAFEEALALLKPMHLTDASTGVWRGLARALLTVPAHDLVREWDFWAPAGAGDGCWFAVPEACGDEHWTRARQLLENAALGTRHSESAAVVLGMTLIGRGDWPTVRAIWERYLELEPGARRVHAAFAWQLVAFGRAEEALEHVARMDATSWLARTVRLCLAGADEAVVNEPQGRGNEEMVVAATAAAVLMTRNQIDDALKIIATHGTFTGNSEFTKLALALRAAGRTEPLVLNLSDGVLEQARGSLGLALILVPSLARPALRDFARAWFAAAQPTLGAHGALAHALWLSRQREHAAALEELARSDASFAKESGAAAVAFEIVARPLWHAALGQRVAPGALDRARKLPIALMAPLDRALTAARASDWANAAGAGLEFNDSLVRDFFLVCNLWEASLRDDTRAVERRRRALRAHVLAVKGDWAALVELEPRVGP